MSTFITTMLLGLLMGTAAAILFLGPAAVFRSRTAIRFRALRDEIFDARLSGDLPDDDRSEHLLALVEIAIESQEYYTFGWLMSLPAPNRELPKINKYEERYVRLMVENCFLGSSTGLIVYLVAIMPRALWARRPWRSVPLLGSLDRLRGALLLRSGGAFGKFQTA